MPETEAATMGLLGLALGAVVNARLPATPGIVGGVPVAARGLHPLLPLFRRLGVRTSREIERGRHALKALRGDFDEVPSPNATPQAERVRAVLRAVDR